MLSFLLISAVALADPEAPPTDEVVLDQTVDAPAVEVTPTEGLREAVRTEDLEALKAALEAGANPWNSASGPTPVWMALDRPREFLQAMVANVPPEHHAALLRVWVRLDPEDPRRTLLDAHVPPALQSTDLQQIRDWQEAFPPAEQQELIRIFGLELLPAAVAFPPERLRRARLWFGDAWLPRIVWQGANAYNFEALPSDAALSDAHQSAIRAGWQELGFPMFMEAELVRQEFHSDGELANLVCGVTGSSEEDQVRGAFGRPAAGRSRRREAHLFWPEVEVFLLRTEGTFRVSRIHMTGDPQGCWSKGARLIGVPTPFARWVLGPEPWVTSDGAQLTVFANNDGFVTGLELVYASQDES